MISKPIENPIIAISVKVYQALLIAYPAKFQQEYGSHMLQVFRDCCLRTVHQSGTNGIVRLWAVTLFDLIQSVVSEHLHKEIEMKKEMKPEDIRRAGWMLILGTPTFILGIYWETSVYDMWIAGFPLLLISIFMLAYGLRGIQARYGGTVGSLGESILQLGVILGPITSLIGLIGAFVIKWLFIFVYTGPAIMLTCLTIFGVIGLLQKPFTLWKILAVFTASWFPIFFFSDQIGGFIRSEWITFRFNNSDLLIMAIPGIAMIVLGYMLQSDVPEEMPAAA